MKRRRVYHRTKPNTRGRRKYQCTAPAAWAPILLAGAKAVGEGMRPTESAGVEIALKLGVRQLADTLGLSVDHGPQRAADRRQIPLPWEDEL